MIRCFTFNDMQSFNIPEINPNIVNASTLPSSIYFDPSIWELAKEKIFARTWQWITHDERVQFNGSVYPFQYIEKFLGEPLMLTRDEEGRLRCLSNVCTHRGFILSHHPAKHKTITCQYHGRRFGLDGRMQFMPEFEQAEDFPRPCDHLQEVPLTRWHQFLLCSLDPVKEWSDIAGQMDRKVGFLPIDQYRYAPEYSKEYLVHAHWALYCDNYLEGFHIPFVHEALNQYLDYGKYETVCYDYCNLQIGYARSGEETFKFPQEHTDYGQEIGAYYFWIFPNMMFNFYPWGLSINVVQPVDISRTKVRFLTFVGDEDLYAAMNAQEGIDKVEREDEYVVEGVQRGLKSRFYDRGRFSPSREQGVHHFHRLLAEFLIG